MITALRFSPDGQMLAVSGNREVLLHHADGSGLVKRLPGRAERILSIAFSADGNLMSRAAGLPRASASFSSGPRGRHAAADR